MDRSAGVKPAGSYRCWCPGTESNRHAFALDFESSVSTNSTTGASQDMAEGIGFEPMDPSLDHGLASRCLGPLGQPSMKVVPQGRLELPESGI